MIQDEYYVVETDSWMFGWDQPSGPYGMGKPVGDPTPVKLKITSRAGKNPTWSDVHEMDGMAVSGKVKEALESLDLYGVEFVPAEVRNPSEPSASPPAYWFMHVWNEIQCLDRENCELTCSKRGRIFSIDKMALSEWTLERLEPRKRMIFYLSEKISTLLVHQSVKEAIESVGATGAKFFLAKEWNNDLIFD